MNELVTQKTLYNYFEKKATRHEKQLIHEWLKQEGNEEIFYRHLAIWESDHLQFSVNTVSALGKYKQLLDGRSDKSLRPTLQIQPENRMPKNLWRYSGFAAAVLLLISVTAFYYQNSFFYTTYSTEFGMTKNIILEDGSEVTLNANSVLRVPKNLTDYREVWLQGEAFFSISKKKNGARFFVYTDNVKVEVLGTQFNVNTRHENTEVVLSEGSVKLSSDQLAGNNTLLMKPGEFVSLSKTDVAFKKREVEPANYNAWKTNLLIFEDMPLSLVAQKIEDYYGIEVEIADRELTKRQVTGTMPNNDLGIVLKSLSASLKMTIERENNKIIFK
jgi:transmembrane sensor